MLLSEWGGNGILSAWAAEGGFGGAASTGLLMADGSAPQGGEGGQGQDQEHPGPG